MGQGRTCVRRVDLCLEGRLCKTILFGLCIFLALLSWNDRAFAYTFNRAENGKELIWKEGRKFPLAGNSANQSGLSDRAIFDATVRALQRWNQASGKGLDFDYWQGGDSRIYEPNSEYNGLSSLYFASRAGSASASPQVLGMSQVWYDADSGQILESDIVLNDVHYQFTLDPTDTTGYGTQNLSSGRSSYRREVFLENVLTHELGHALGLSHSGSLQSSMLFMESPEQAFLSCDDQVAIHALYGDRGIERLGRGTLSGRILRPDGRPLLGAQVVAISQDRNTVLGTALTDQQGNYAVQSLEVGSYHLLVEPFYAGSTVLPEYYRSLQHGICENGLKFSRSFIMDHTSSEPQSVTVTSRKTTRVKDWVVVCAEGQAYIPQATDGNALRTAPLLIRGSQDIENEPLEKVIADQWISSESTKLYLLEGIGGKLRVQAMSYSLYSPIQVELRLLDEFGRPVSAEYSPAIFEGVSGYSNYDTSLVAKDLPFGSYYLEAIPNSMSRTLYPGGPIAVDAAPFMLLTVSSNSNDSNQQASLLSKNPRCRMEEKFPPYTSPPGTPLRHQVQNDGDSVGLCGNLNLRNPRSGGSGSGGGGFSGGAEALSWALPWFIMLYSLRRSRRLILKSPSQLAVH